MTCFTKRSDRFAVCHIPKTAGHTVREYMAAAADEEVADLENMYASPPHLALRDWPSWINRDARTFDYIIAVVRNPYEQQVSQWLYWLDRYRRGMRMHDGCIGAAMYPDLESWLADPLSDWHVYDARRTGTAVRTIADSADFVRMDDRGVQRIDRVSGYERFGGYYPYWLEVDGAMPDNLVLIRFERLGEDLPQLAQEIFGRDCGPTHRTNTGPGTRDIHEYYSPRSAAMVEAKFRWAFESGTYPRMRF